MIVVWVQSYFCLILYTDFGLSKGYQIPTQGERFIAGLQLSETSRHFVYAVKARVNM